MARLTGTYAESKAGRCRTASEVAPANVGWDGRWAADLWRSGRIPAHYDLGLPLRWIERSPPAQDLRQIDGREVSLCTRGGPA